MDGTAQLVDDGAYDHLRPGMAMPEVALPATTGGAVDIVASTPFTVLFLYPMTRVPGRPLPDRWMEIPGAFGCTAESCGFRDLVDGFDELDATIHGVSNQTPDEQKEFATRENIGYPLLSDAEHELIDSLSLPLLEIAGHESRIKRATLIVDRRRTLRKVMYPVPDPSGNAQEALAEVKRLANDNL